jgi:exosortase/archaeosortase family protein
MDSERDQLKNQLKVEPMALREVAVFFAFFVSISWVFQLFPSGWLEYLTAMFSYNVLRMLGFSSNWGIHEGVAYLSLVGGVRDVSVTIIRECTGIHVFAILTGLVLPLRGGLWLKKILSLSFAGIILSILNISRVILTILLTAYDVPPFVWIFTNPTVETYHYPLSFVYGLFGVALLLVVIVRLILPELGDTLISISLTLKKLFRSQG